MKEVIFHFFPSARFLGLSLKILFHKNKEIKRMLSKKMTFSLMSLITLLAFAFVVPSAIAQKEFKVEFEGRASVNVAATGDSTAVTLKVTTAQPVADMDTTSNDIDNTLGLTALVVDRNGLTIEYAAAITDDATFAVMKTAKVRRFSISLPTIAADGQDNLPYTIYITVPALTTNDPTVATKDMANVSKAAIHKITLNKSIADIDDLPSVVSIQRLRPGSQTVVSAFQEEKITTAPFDVRIVLTKAHTADPLNAENLVEVENGVASALVVGETFLRRNGSGAEVRDMEARGATSYPHPIEGMYQHLEASNVLDSTPGRTTDGDDFIPAANSDDWMYRQYRVTITPHQKSADFVIKIRVKEFHDGKAPIRRTYLAPGFGDSGHLKNGRDILSINVKGTARNLEAGYRVIIPKDWIIPAGGYLVIAQNAAGSEVVTGPAADPGKWRTNDTPRATHRTPAQLLYNVIGMSSLPNLATGFLNGVVVDVESQHPGLVISEVMWGEDVSLDQSSNSQYIELYNPGGQYKTVDDADHTPDVNEALTLIFYAPNEFSAVAARTAVAATATAAATTALPTGVTDRIGTLDAKGTYWSPAGKGQSGRSGTTATGTAAERGAFVPVVAVVSMYRAMVPSIAVGAAVGAMMVEDGQTAANWTTSAGPKSANFDPLAIGVRHGTPGAATDATSTPADAAAEKKAAADKAAAAVKKTESTGTMPEDGQIYISEIMFAGGGTLPQWIEIANGSKSEEINLSGWTLTVDNAAADADVSIGASAKFTIPDGTTIDMSGQQTSPSTILVVTEAGRNNIDDSGQVLNLAKDNEVDLLNAGVTTMRKYTLLSDMAFLIRLAPPEPGVDETAAEKKTRLAAEKAETADEKTKRTAAEKKAKNARKKATDMVGNLGADGAATWALPMSEDGRSSIIRRHVPVSVGPAEPEDGTMMDNWALASDTNEGSLRTESFYGAVNDVGTPGFRAGGALPVQLSHFRPARNKDTGAVVITWSTQSELNNAGFFIKRSQQRDGEFKVINATMIQGAGTTSEKQFYTYNDSTAQPNVVYYYQIEDVSLDGNRQTLTNGIRLKGHVSVAGKLTTLWGDLKTSQ